MRGTLAKHWNGWTLAACLALVLGATAARAQTLPQGFSLDIIVNDLEFPTAVVFTPDGRMFQNERLTGNVRVIEAGALVAEPRFPPILNDFVCLRMNQKRFDGRLRFVWRV